MLELKKEIAYNYRLAEALFHPEPHPSELHDIILKNYPNTIAAYYLSIPKNEYHLNMLKAIGNLTISDLKKQYPDLVFYIFQNLLEAIKVKYPDFNFNDLIPTHSFHCRVGDVIDCCSNHSVNEHLHAYIASSSCSNFQPNKDVPLSIINDECYCKPLSHYSNFLSDHVSLIGGGCFHSFFNDVKSKEYFGKIKNHLIKNCTSVFSSYRSDPDEDFLYLLQSEHFTKSSGRYGELIFYFRQYLFDLYECNKPKSRVKFDVNKKFAVFIPCLFSEYEDGSLLKYLKSLYDSLPEDSDNYFDIHICFNYLDSITGDFNFLQNHKCINNLYIHNLNIEKENDINIFPWDNPDYDKGTVPRLGLSSGPNESFFRSIWKLIKHPSNYDSFLLLETDTLFVDKSWLTKCIDFINYHNFYIAGSRYEGVRNDHKDKDYSDHLNGVAIYKNCKELHDLLLSTESYIAEEVAKGLSFYLTPKKQMIGQPGI